MMCYIFVIVVLYVKYLLWWCYRPRMCWIFVIDILQSFDVFHVCYDDNTGPRCGFVFRLQMQILMQKAADAHAVVTSLPPVAPSSGGAFAWLWSLLDSDWGHGGLDTHHNTARHLQLAIEYIAKIFNVSNLTVVGHILKCQSFLHYQRHLKPNWCQKNTVSVSPIVSVSCQ